MSANILDELARSAAPKPHIKGATAEEKNINPEAALKQVIRDSKSRKKREVARRAQTITFDHGPVCIVNFADMHVGGTGVDYERLWADIDLTMNTPGMYIGLAGDLLDNYIIGKLQALQITRAFSVDREWALVRRVVEEVAPKLLWSVSGNHDLWTYMLTGVDYFRDVHAQFAPGVLYDQHQILVDIHVGRASYRWKIRHKWRGNSMYNDTHPVERAAKFDKGDGFDVGVMAHTHTSGLARQFNNGGRTGLAVICGSYKRYDDYAERLGLNHPNEQCAVPVILDEQGGIITVSNLETAAHYMRTMYPKEVQDGR